MYLNFQARCINYEKVGGKGADSYKNSYKERKKILYNFNFQFPYFHFNFFLHLTPKKKSQ